MLSVLRNSWALLLGITLLMLGNGIQGTLLGVRGELEGFSTGAMSVVMSSYFAGFLLGSQLVPSMIKRVGHVRVFAALGSLASAGLILYPALVDPIAWTVLRLLLGFCFCGVYIVAESWLNNTTTNETRGRALSLYLIAQMVGIVAAQALFTLGDAAEYELFITVSVLVSLAFAPILLSATPVPPFETAKAMSFRQLYRVSPLGFVGIFLLGAVFSGLFGMAGVYGALEGLSPGQIALLASSIYAGGMLLQYPIGWLSDRVDRRQLVVACAVLGALACLLGVSGLGGYQGMLAAAFLVGGMANPLYALLLAYTNDFLGTEDMASASAQLLFVNGVGAIGGPLVTGWLMGKIGPGGFWVFTGVQMALLAAYALWRMTRRKAVEIEESAPYVPIAGTGATPVMMTTIVDEWEEQIANEKEEAA
ncbi:MFS transporter [Jannaschia seohaensis]|uniref:Predicted arabinose efflux permease, MFS family n=1 Tax=Jannaschia seohaensis TaxID=475081 RepID=A0A2Y9B411_9RHOB|nr:MFS transporter [Jannaschia seohaensis]PWJ12137.1 putative MFS family arabinose efflux permease [Jannaschia seohaensis]SSA51240.1 Predicted arabinose efflux permease, MFS family [Jannaschia seohaensis]